MAGADIRLLEIAQNPLAEHVVADLRHHNDVGAEFGRGNRLVGAFAAVAHLEARRGDRLAPDRHALDIGDEVDVARSDDADARTFGHAWLPPVRRAAYRAARRRSTMSTIAMNSQTANRKAPAGTVSRNNHPIAPNAKSGSPRSTPKTGQG